MGHIADGVVFPSPTSKTAPCGLRGCKNWPAPFPGRMLYKATKPGLVSVLYLSMRRYMLLFIRAPFMYC